MSRAVSRWRYVPMATAMGALGRVGTPLAWGVEVQCTIWVFVCGPHVELLTPATHVYDDCQHLEISSTAQLGRSAMETMLTFLGWKFKTAGPKAADFAVVFTTLGCVIDLSQARCGVVCVAN